MKLIVFSDVHGNLDVFENFIKKIERINYDKVIFLGDFLGYYYNAEEIISYARKNKFHCILGNHDMYFLPLKNKELFLV